MKTLSAYVMIALYIVTLPASPLHGQVQEGRRIIVGGDFNYPPYEFINDSGEPDGFNVELTRAVAEVMGLEFEIRLGPWSSVRRALESGEIDVVQGLFKSPEREKSYDFTRPHNIVEHTLFKRREDPVVHGLEELAGREVIVMEGDIMHDFLLENDLGCRIVTVEEQVSALRMLSSGRHDYAMVARVPGLYWLDRLRLSNISPIGLQVITRQYCYGVLEGNAALLDKFQHGMDILQQTGRFSEIYSKWLGVYHAPGIAEHSLYKYLLIGMLVLLLVIVAVSLWLRSLRVQVSRRTLQLEREIAEKEAVQEKLARSESQFRGLFENVLVGMYRTTPDGRVLMANNGLVGLLGYESFEQLKEVNLEEAEFMAGHPRSKFRELVELHGEIKGYENVWLKRNGEKVHVRENARAIRDESGEVLYYEGTVEDITEKKLAEKAVQDNLHFLQVLIDAIPNPVFVKDADGVYRYCNTAFLEFTRLERKEVICRTAFDIAPADLAEVYHRADRQIMKEKGHQVYESEIMSADGRRRSVLFNKAVIVDDRGEAQGIVGIILDITERKRNEESLRKSETRLRNVLDAVHTGILLIDPETHLIVDANPVASDMIGLPAERIVGRHCHDFVCPQDSGKCPITDMNMRIDQKECSLKCADESLMPILKTVSVVELNGKEHLVETFSDIREQKLLEEERNKASKLESIGNLAGGIAHDFNNILTSVIGNIALAKIFANGDENLGGCLKDAEISCRQATSLANRLLTFSRGGTPVKKVAELTPTIKSYARLATHGSNVRCSFELPDDLWSCEFDEHQIGQVINNVVMNSREAMPGGGEISISGRNATLEEQEHCPDDKQGNFVRITVADHGRGIEADLLSKIFDPYFTTKDSPDQKGCGLGLSTAHSIVRKHGGYIRVESEPGRGSRFHIFLPASPRQMEKRQGSRETVFGSSGRILIMDDEESVCRVVARFLGHLGFETETVHDGEQALHAFRRAEQEGAPFDAAILDLTIPGGMGGIETVGRLKEIRADVKAVVCSGYSNAPVVADYRAHGFDASVSKPFELDSLRKLLFEHLGLGNASGGSRIS